EYCLCVVLRKRVETGSSRRGVGEMSRLADRRFDRNRRGFGFLQVRNGRALRRASARSHLHAITYLSGACRNETRMEAISISFARRAVSGHCPINCTKRARNLKMKKSA